MKTALFSLSWNWIDQLQAIGKYVQQRCETWRTKQGIGREGGMAITTAKNVALYFIGTLPGISNLKLQKLLYYAQAWHLGLYREPLFRDEIQAWVHGPVVPVVFREYRNCGWSPIPVQTVPSLPGEVVTHLDEVTKAYGDLSAAQLEQLSHGEDPWLTTRGNLHPEKISSAVISHESMRDYFVKLMNG